MLLETTAAALDSLLASMRTHSADERPRLHTVRERLFAVIDAMTAVDELDSIKMVDVELDDLVDAAIALEQASDVEWTPLTGTGTPRAATPGVAIP